MDAIVLIQTWGAVVAGALALATSTGAFVRWGEVKEAIAQFKEDRREVEDRVSSHSDEIDKHTVALVRFETVMVKLPERVSGLEEAVVGLDKKLDKLDRKVGAALSCISCPQVNDGDAGD